MAGEDKGPAITADVLADALLKLPADKLKIILDRAGFTAPSTAGITPEQLTTILQTVGKTSAKAMQESLRHENPWYPEKSVFLPRGRFDDAGQQQEPKRTFTHDVYFVNVRLGRAGDAPELMTEDEIELCNRLAASGHEKTCRDGQWRGGLIRRGNREVLDITVPCLTVDDRMNLAPLTHILLALLEGEDRIQPDTLMKEVATLKAKVAALEGTAAVA